MHSANDNFILSQWLLLGLIPYKDSELDPKGKWRFYSPGPWGILKDSSCPTGEVYRTPPSQMQPKTRNFITSLSSPNNVFWSHHFYNRWIRDGKLTSHKICALAHAWGWWYHIPGGIIYICHPAYFYTISRYVYMNSESIMVILPSQSKEEKYVCLLAVARIQPSVLMC